MALLAFLLQLAARLLKVCDEDEDSRVKIFGFLWSLAGLFCFLWFIVGNFWVFGSKIENHKSGGDFGDHKGGYSYYVLTQYLQGPAKRWGLGCVNSLTGSAWLKLSKQPHLFADLCATTHRETIIYSLW